MSEDRKPFPTASDYIGVYDPVKPVKDALAKTDEAVKRTNEALDRIKDQQKDMMKIIIAIVSIVATGFVTLIIATFSIFIDHKDYAEQRYNKYIELLEAQEQQVQKGISGLEAQDNQSIDSGKTDENNKQNDASSGIIKTD